MDFLLFSDFEFDRAKVTEVGVVLLFEAFITTALVNTVKWIFYFLHFDFPLFVSFGHCIASAFFALVCIMLFGEPSRKKL